MGFPQAISRIQATVFDRLGEPALWGDEQTAVRVRRPRDGDEDFRADYGQLVVTGAVIRVRKSEVAAPAEGDQVQILDDDGNALADGLFTISAEPMLDRKKQVWTCRANPAA